MSTAQILDELPSLPRSDREKILQKLEEIELATIRETPEILDAIDAGRQSLRDSPLHSVEYARQQIGQWTSKSS